MHRFFIDKEDINGEVVKIKGNDFNHISHSLRLQTGDRIIACDGEGKDYLLELADFSDKAVLGRIVESRLNSSEPSVKITLAQAIPKKGLMEWIIQKGTELGITSFIPLMTGRTIVRLSGKKGKKRVERWQRIAEEAAKQSGRGIIPRVMEIISIKELTRLQEDYGLVLLLWEDEKELSFSKIRERLQSSRLKEVLIIIGPEGGFSPEEVQLITTEGGLSLSLGPRILRTETAGLVAATLTLYESANLE